MRQCAQAARGGDQPLTIDREIFRQQSNGNRSSELRVASAKEISGARHLESLEQVVVRDHADRRGRRFSHERSASMTLCNSSFASLICSSTIETSIVGLPGCRALWQYTPCCPTIASASVNRSIATASRPRSRPIIVSCFSSSSWCLLKTDFSIGDSMIVHLFESSL